MIPLEFFCENIENQKKEEEELKEEESWVPITPTKLEENFIFNYISTSNGKFIHLV